MPHDAHTFNGCVEMMSGDRSTIDRRLVGDRSQTSRKPLQLVGDRNHSWLVFCACPKDWPRLILYGDRSPNLLRPCWLRPCCDLCKTLPRPLQPQARECHFFSRDKVAARLQALVDRGLTYRRVVCVCRGGGGGVAGICIAHYSLYHCFLVH